MPNKYSYPAPVHHDVDDGHPITPRSHHNYVAFFLTLGCNLNCVYCINLHEKAPRRLSAHHGFLSAEQWVQAANRLRLRADLPLTLQGGEPTLYRGFYHLVNETRPEIKMDLLTNMTFDVQQFIRNVPVWRFDREAPYASIRVSYHPGQNDIDELIEKTRVMQDAGFRVGLYGIDHPDPEIASHVRSVKSQCDRLGLDFRIKEFLGKHQDKLHGTYKYDDAVMGTSLGICQCRTTELLVDPSGHVFRCHSDLYNGRAPIAHILDNDFDEASIDTFRDCQVFGECNPCDVKVKTNRHQVFGHTSVEIRNIRLAEEKRRKIA